MKMKSLDGCFWVLLQQCRYVLLCIVFKFTLQLGDMKMSWTEKDLKEFEQILDLCEAKGFDNANRIFGRLDYNKFAERFTKEELKEMAEKLGAKPLTKVI